MYRKILSISTRLILLTLLVALNSCSNQSILKLITKTPKIDYQSPIELKSLSDFHKDAIYIVEIIKETYPRLYQKVPHFDEEAKKFIKKIAETENEKYFDIELKRFISILKDGHSNAHIHFSKYDKTRYSLSLFKEKEDWVISNIDVEIDSSVIGKRIVSINGIPIKEIEQRILDFECGENKYWKYLLFRNYCSYPSYWEALGVVLPENNALKFVVENQEGISQFTLKDKLERKRYKLDRKKSNYLFRYKQNNGFYDTISQAKNFAYLQMNTSLDYVCIKSEIDNYTNFLTKPLALNFLKREKKDARDFGKFLQSFFLRVHEQKIENLIIDLSYNTGGDERTGKQLIWYLTENNNLEGFTDYLKNSAYFKTQIKKDYKLYNELYRAKHQTDLPKGEVNITEQLFNDPYFEDITNEGSPFTLDETIPKFKGNVYVIISPRTFSAGQVLATTIADNQLATIIGKPTGNKPSTQTGASMFKLPNTKKIVSISYFYMERPDKTKNQEVALYPDIEFHKTFQNSMNGDDILMEYILNKNEK